MTKVDIIKEKILDEILTGRLGKGDAVSSRHQFMRRYDCARGTIDQAIRELSRDGFLFSRKGAGTFVAGVPSDNPIQQLIIIGGNNLFSEEDFNQRNSLNIISDVQYDLPCYLFDSRDINVNMSKITRSGSVVIWSCPPYEQLQTMKYLEKLGIPQVLVGRIYSNLNYITTDAKEGILEGLEWLIDVGGKQELVFISQTINSDRPYLAERQIAFYEAAVKLGIPLKEENIHLSSFANLSKEINRLGKSLFKKGTCPKTVFLTEIQAALSLVSYATACGYEPGRDFHILLFDENQVLKGYDGVGMLKQQWDQMRKEAVNWVQRICRGKPEKIHMKIKPKLILGKSESAS